MFLAIVLLMFAIDAAGRSLGLDAWLRRNVPAVRDGTGFIGKLLRLAGQRGPRCASFLNAAGDQHPRAT